MSVIALPSRGISTDPSSGPQEYSSPAPALADEDIYMSIDDLDEEACPPDMRFQLAGGREAWVYDHGTVAELVMVRLGR